MPLTFPPETEHGNVQVQTRPHEDRSHEGREIGAEEERQGAEEDCEGGAEKGRTGAGEIRCEAVR